MVRREFSFRQGARAAFLALTAKNVRLSILPLSRRLAWPPSVLRPTRVKGFNGKTGNVANGVACRSTGRQAKIFRIFPWPDGNNEREAIRRGIHLMTITNDGLHG